MIKKGLLIVNLGTPSSYNENDIKKFLLQFLSDKRVIHAPQLIWQIILRLFILPKRIPKLAKLYEEIWLKDKNASPLYFYTQEIAKKLSMKIGGDFKIDFAMRYGIPSISDKLKMFDENSIKDVIVLPLYPQFSYTTTSSIFDDVDKYLHESKSKVKITKINSYFSNTKYIKTICIQVKDSLKKINFSPDYIVFSMHGIPKKYSDKGDPYYSQCLECFMLIKKEIAKQGIRTKCLLSFQSRFGPSEWLQPYTTDTLRECALNNKSVLLVAPGFACDCLETLEELSKEEKQIFLDNGGKNFAFVPCLNADDIHINLLCDVAYNYY